MSSVTFYLISKEMNINRNIRGTPTHITSKQPTHNRVQKQVMTTFSGQTHQSKKRNLCMFLYE